MVQPIPRVGVALPALALVAFFGFIVFAWAAPAMLGQPVLGAVPLSFVLTGALIVGTILLTAVYVGITNAAETRR